MQNIKFLNNKKSKKFKRTLFIVLMLAFPVSQFLVFWVYANFNSILMAFQDYSGFNAVGFTLSNFERFFKELMQADSFIRRSIFNSLWFFPVGNFISLPIATILSYILYKGVRGNKVFRVIFFLPSIISSVVMVTVFKNILAVDGPLHFILKSLGMNNMPIWLADERFAFPTILLYTVWAGLGYNIILLSAAISRIPVDIFEYNRLEGLGLFKELTTVVIRLIWPTLTTLFVIGTSSIFTTVAPIVLFTNGQYNTGTIAFYIFNEVKYAGVYNYPSAVGLIFTFIAMPIILLSKKIMEKIGDDIEF